MDVINKRDFERSEFNTLRPKQNCRNFPDDIFKCIFFNENIRISIEMSLKFVPVVPINNTPALVQILAWRQAGDKSLSKPMMVSLLTHLWVTLPQWVDTNFARTSYITTAPRDCLYIRYTQHNLLLTSHRSGLWIRHLFKYLHLMGIPPVRMLLF